MIRADITVEQVKQLVYDLYGLPVSQVSKLNGYDDKNFRIIVNQGVDGAPSIKDVENRGYVFKVVNSLDSEDESKFEAHSAVLLHLNQHNILCPIPVTNKYNKPYKKVTLSSGEHVVWLLSYIEGCILHQVQGTSDLFHQVGVLTAEIDVALQTFHHDVYHKRIQWSFASAADVINYLHAVKDQDKQTLVRNIIREFSDRVLSVENDLDKGIIHGDINEQNIIVEKKDGGWRIKGIIDFGDTHYDCYLYELAIAIVYMIFTSNDISTGGCVVSGYSTIRTIPPKEFNLLKICVMTRYCQSLVYGAHASLQDPGNEYILTTGKTGWNLLQQIYNTPEDDLLNLWKQNLKC